MVASLTATQRTTEKAFEYLQRQLAWARAREKAVEDGVLALYRGPYMPTPAAVMHALCPTEERIRQYLDEGVS